jgi:hypothetical protein
VRLDGYPVLPLQHSGLHAMVTMSIFAPTLFVACNVDRDGLFPGKPRVACN